MARFYSAFDNVDIPALETIDAANAYTRVTMTDGAALRIALLAARTSLSSAAMAQINAGNQDGTLGIVVPRDAVTRSGGDYSWSNLYTNAGAIWPADPRVRPTAPILIAGSTPVAPTDAGTFSDSLYTGAQTALENVLAAMTGGGPRGRFGQDPYRTLASLWHDHALTFFAWDDFTPGQPTSFAVSGLGSTTNFAAALTYGFQYRSDQRTGNTAQIVVTLTRTDGLGSEVYTQERTLTGGTYPTLSGLNVAFTSQYPLAAGTYQLSAIFTIEDAVIPAHAGATAFAVENNVTIAAL